jgi:hypothetical protein
MKTFYLTPEVLGKIRILHTNRCKFNFGTDRLGIFKDQEAAMLFSRENNIKARPCVRCCEDTYSISFRGKYSRVPVMHIQKTNIVKV